MSDARIRPPRRFGICLVKDTHDLGFKFREIEAEDGAAGMEDEIAAGGQQVRVAAQDLAQAALDAVAVMGLAQDLAGGQADTRRGGKMDRGQRARGGLRGQEPAHGSGLALAGGGVGALIVGMPGQTQAGKGLRSRRRRAQSLVRIRL